MDTNVQSTPKIRITNKFKVPQIGIPKNFNLQIKAFKCLKHKKSRLQKS